MKLTKWVNSKIKEWNCAKWCDQWIEQALIIIWMEHNCEDDLMRQWKCLSSKNDQCNEHWIIEWRSITSAHLKSWCEDDLVRQWKWKNSKNEQCSEH